MKTLDRIFCGLLILSGILHAWVTIRENGHDPGVLLWSLCASLFIFLLGAVNWVRSGRQGDRTLSWIALIFNLCWIGVCLQFGRVIHDMRDFRVVDSTIVALVLCAMSLRTLVTR